MNPIREAWESVWRRRDLRPIYEWARENTYLCAPLTITGPFDVSRSRHFIGPLDALQDDAIREVNILKPVRGGGTLIADIYIPWARVNDPGPTMMVLQTDPLADDHFTKVLSPTLESVPVIAKMLAALGRHKETKRKIEFDDGNHLHVNGPSIGNLQTNAFRFLIEDECWLYPDKMGDAEGRVGDFEKLETSKILRISQGGPAPGVEMHECSWRRKYHEATIHEWEAQCPYCQAWYCPVFSGQNDDGSFWGITWDHSKFANGDWDIRKCCESVRFECPHCHKPHTDGSRIKGEWNRTGRYKLTTEGNRKAKSFHWETVIDYPWDELVKLWLSACNAERRGDLQPKLQFYQKRRAMFMDEESLLKRGLSLSRVAYSVQTDWPEEEARFMTIDRQEEDVYWWTVRAWSKEKSRRLGFGKANGAAELDKIRDSFHVPPNRTGIDSAFFPKGDNGVYRHCTRYGWVALKGDAKWSFTHQASKSRRVQKCYAPLAWGDPGSGTIEQGRKYAPLVVFSKPQMNQRVQGLIDAGKWEEPTFAEGDEMEAEYNAQMAGRVRRTDFNKKTGETRVFFYETKNDHARDLANHQVLFAIMIGLVSDPAAETQTTQEQNAK